MKKALQLIQDQLELLAVSSNIQSKVEGKLNDSRREFYLRQQLKAIKVGFL
jgi:ATP-dependent Lon protease